MSIKQLVNDMSCNVTFISEKPANAQSQSNSNAHLYQHGNKSLKMPSRKAQTLTVTKVQWLIISTDSYWTTDFSFASLRCSGNSIKHFYTENKPQSINYITSSLWNFNSWVAWIKYSSFLLTFGTLQHWGWYEFMTQLWLYREAQIQINALEPVALPQGTSQTSHGLSVNAWGQAPKYHQTEEDLHCGSFLLALNVLSSHC